MKKDELLNGINLIRLELWRGSVPYCKALEEKINVLENTITLIKVDEPSAEPFGYLQSMKLMHDDFNKETQSKFNKFTDVCSSIFEMIQELARKFEEHEAAISDINEHGLAVKQLDNNVRSFMEVIKHHFISPAVKPENKITPEDEKKRRRHLPRGTTDDEMFEAIKQAGGGICEAAKILKLAAPSIYSRMRNKPEFQKRVKAFQDSVGYCARKASSQSYIKRGQEPSEKAKKKSGVVTATFENIRLRDKVVAAIDDHEGCKEKIAEACKIKLATLEIMLMRDKELADMVKEYE